ncbi:TPA: hypothetical protein ACR6NY_001955, partial [Klebsiella pneumoniae]
MKQYPFVSLVWWRIHYSASGREYRWPLFRRRRGQARILYSINKIIMRRTCYEALYASGGGNAGP